MCYIWSVINFHAIMDTMSILKEVRMIILIYAMSELLSLLGPRYPNEWEQLGS